MICGSVQGVLGTGNLNDQVDVNEETTEYLSRHRSVWDDDEEE